MKFSIMRGTNFVHTLLRNKIKHGDVVIDGTMGNGYDTLFLAELVGKEGKVFAFDIQATSLESTRKRLEDKEVFSETIHLIHDGHENIPSYISEEIDAAMFNLGYLPGSDHSLITKPDTTLKALESVMKLLKKGGLISIMIYYGHEGGNQEKEAILDMLENLPPEEYVVIKTEYMNRKNDPPIIVIVEKK
ncbi:tRNA (mnm(5)s(2)U34)-methyltransferase [Alkaliphilus transvaalensis]|uniref:tRNA (mnm(5)s(2)U34)-methyltransferase n=1 Tax=Alkaliphilus transvaalensis TaxID=114628 RepID=UPI00047B4A16|nr:class I SAM-dependent methyltransferase [Alkaliphilus transvaalensis]